MAIEASLRLFFKILWNKKPINIFQSIVDKEKNVLIPLSDKYLEESTKLKRRSWQVRVLRYGEIVPDVLFSLDPTSVSFKRSLKQWIRDNIPNDGDYIFRC